MFNEEKMAANPEDLEELLGAGYAAGNDDESDDDAPPSVNPLAVTKTQAFSRRLQEKLDDQIASFGWMNHYTKKPIRTRADLMAFYQQQEGGQMHDDQGEDPVLYNQLADLKRKVTMYEHRDTNAAQDQRLANDEEVGMFYRSVRNDVQAIAHEAGVDIESAFMVLLRQNAGKLMGDVKKQTQDDTLRKALATQTASPGSLSSGTDAKPGISNMPPADFAALVKRAERGELKSN